MRSAFTWLANVLKEIIDYYDRRGQSRVRRQLPPRFVPSDWNKSLDQLADEFDLAKPTPDKVFVKRPELLATHSQLVVP